MFGRQFAQGDLDHTFEAVCLRLFLLCAPRKENATDVCGHQGALLQVQVPRKRSKTGSLLRAGMVYLTNGTTHPTPMGIWKAVKTFNEPKTKAGRPKGTKKTTNAEHKVIMTTFHKKRPPGYGIEARDVHKALPKKLQQKVSTRTVRRRLADKGYTPQKKGGPR